MLADMLRHINREEFEPVLVTLFYWEGKDYFYELIPPDVPVYRLAFKGFWDVRGWMQLYRLLRRLGPDIVLSNLFFSNTVLRILKPLFRYRVISVEHNTYVKKTKTHQVIDRVLALITSRIVAVSSTVASFTAQQEGIPIKEFLVIHAGIDVERIQRECAKYDTAQTKKELGLAADARVILSVARLTRQKNPRLLVDGFALFAREHQNYELVMVGDGGDWIKTLGAHAKARGIGERVHLVGTRTDVARFYAIADFFVSTSAIEGFGIAHAEALACGVPLLSTKTAGPDEMIRDSENGFFITEHTPEAVKTGMEKMVRSNLPQMRIRAREMALAYSINRTAEAYEKLFLQVHQR